MSSSNEILPPKRPLAERERETAGKKIQIENRLSPRLPALYGLNSNTRLGFDRAFLVASSPARSLAPRSAVGGTIDLCSPAPSLSSEQVRVHVDLCAPCTGHILSYLLMMLLISDDGDASGENKKMEHEETGCQAAPEGPILCINNCGFFGSPATMNMCSKCHKDMLLKQEQAKLAESSIGSLVNGSSSCMDTEPVAVAVATSVDAKLSPVEPQIAAGQQTVSSSLRETVEAKPGEGPNRCTTCKKRVGLTGFSCRCGNLFCGSHRYSDKHDCPFDYRTAARDAIAKANPLVKAKKLDKI
ncbi:hypothetical protein SAY86_022863 [Trapa natans]|uniref:Zinc finger A20 and AN1 domain-containing stress-associated protein 8 n=1 Tax=Trapa natans TaxID=22666 RepID=A0AAN7M6C7_TRANT|nr:hypothetical protein SAY86_022863 [Trapa natans]